MFKDAPVKFADIPKQDRCGEATLDFLANEDANALLRAFLVITQVE